MNSTVRNGGLGSREILIGFAVICVLPFAWILRDGLGPSSVSMAGCCCGVKGIHEFLHRASDSLPGVSGSGDRQVYSRSRLTVTGADMDRLGYCFGLIRLAIVRYGLARDDLNHEHVLA